jgi:hypothetical protein
MPRLRFNIASLLVVVLFLALDFVAQRESNDLWDSGLFTSTLGVLLISTSTSRCGAIDEGLQPMVRSSCRRSVAHGPSQGDSARARGAYLLQLQIRRFKEITAETSDIPIASGLDGVEAAGTRSSR